MTPKVTSPMKGATPTTDSQIETIHEANQALWMTNTPLMVVIEFTSQIAKIFIARLAELIMNKSKPLNITPSM
jgi:hypothetical protein